MECTCFVKQNILYFHCVTVCISSGRGSAQTPQAEELCLQSEQGQELPVASAGCPREGHQPPRRGACPPGLGAQDGVADGVQMPSQGSEI